MTFATHRFQGILPQSDGFLIRSQPTRTDGVRHNNSIASLQFSNLGIIIGLKCTIRDLHMALLNT